MSLKIITLAALASTLLSVSVVKASEFSSIQCKCGPIADTVGNDMQTQLVDLKKFKEVENCFARNGETFSLSSAKNSFSIVLRDKDKQEVARTPVAVANTIVELSSSDRSTLLSCYLHYNF